MGSNHTKNSQRKPGNNFKILKTKPSSEFLSKQQTNKKIERKKKKKKGESKDVLKAHTVSVIREGGTEDSFFPRKAKKPYKKKGEGKNG